ncbi:RloB family protein [Herbivorax sp. ANBcel31]|uniref:RloB family protein n=1 Tax=Herbivorax sp. ANBcel31 TaxID=3069754 RepID=UPI0027B834E1|nr:RloB family protein [Herbivorax sp. ANBcel31]MDQ2085217.1 RloB family protein [Herbivorax sp. ANBcel31]
MGRTKLSPRRLVEFEKEYLGKILIFCEGKTEKNYFDYFVEIIKNNKYTDIKVEIQNVHGNSQTVYNYAEHFLSKEENNRKYMNYKKYLVFDCDDPPNIQSVILKILSSDTDYTLLVSNYFFEIWLLMYFEKVKFELRKNEISQKLNNHLSTNYKKGAKGIIREIILKGNVEKAIENAETLAKKYKSEGKTLSLNITEMNPYTNVHTLVKQLMMEIS